MGEVGVVHVVYGAHGIAAAEGRAKQLPRAYVCSAERLLMANALDEVMTALGMTNGALARRCLVDEKVVRCWRLGSRRFGDVQLEAMGNVGAEVRRILGGGSGL